MLFVTLVLWLAMFLVCPREARRRPFLPFLCSIFVLLREYAYNKIFLACYCVVAFGHEAMLLVTIWSAPSVCLVLCVGCPGQSLQHLCKVSFPSFYTWLTSLPRAPLHQAACHAAVLKESDLVFSGEVWGALPERSFGTAQSYERCQDPSPLLPAGSSVSWVHPETRHLPNREETDWLCFLSSPSEVYFDPMRRVEEYNTVLDLHERVINH